jgi:hypothetical protein
VFRDGPEGRSEVLDPSRSGGISSRLRIRHDTMQAGIHQMFRESAAVKLRFAEQYAPRIEAVARRMADALRRENSCSSGTGEAQRMPSTWRRSS